PPPAGRGAADLASVIAALEERCSSGDDPTRRRLAHGRRRGALTMLMMVLLVAGVIELFTLTPEVRPAVDGGSRASVVFGNAQTGTCLSWPPDAPDKPSFVQCRSDHMFEVAKPVGMNSFGEPCQLAVREYLGTRYDPSSRFTISVLWAGDADGTNTGGRNLLCGLQLLGPDGKPIPFKGRIVDLDQSKVWPPGTCLGIDSSNRSTDIPVDCTVPHALEVTGAVSLAERFPGTRPSDADQRAFITQACTKAADAYLAPATLARSDLSLGYETLSPASWLAGSRQVSCSVGRPAEQGWIASTSSARNLSPADLPPPAAPEPSPREGAPPPVYEEPLVPIPTEVPANPPAPVAPPLAPPVVPPTTESAPPAPTTTSAPPPATTTTTTTAPPSEEPPPALGPAPGPAAPPSENSESQPGILQIPGLAPITLPGYVPPEPAAPPP
ncbi:MAG: septum formation family protein, partial [Myxococcota bacterium]